MEWLEWKYDCNFVTRIKKDEIAIAGEHNEGYGVTTQKEIFEILSRCHCIPHNKDAIFDYGCGKVEPWYPFWTMDLNGRWS